MNFNFFESLDQEPADSNIWVKYQPSVESPIVAKGLLKKHSKDNESNLSLGSFILQRDYLLYKKNENADTPSSCIKIKYARLTLPGVDESDCTPASQIREKFAMKLCYKGKYSLLYAQNQHEFDTWVQNFTQVVFRTDFHSRFTVTKMIGSGAFANVYLATEKATNNKYAVKGFNKHYLESETKGKLSLWNEISILREMKHPNLLKLYEVHETKNSVYLVFDLLEGGELNKLFEQKKVLSQPEIVTIMHGLLEGINFMATRGLVHRDLKPSNIMVRTNTNSSELDKNSVVIVDFGLATSVHSKSFIYKRCGTAGYIAPEIIGAQIVEEKFTVTTKCDVFSLGIIMYVLATGKNPFDKQGEQIVDQIIRKNLECKIDFNVPALKYFSSEFIQLMKGMLIANPEIRPSAADCLKSSLFSEDDEASSDLEIPDEMMAPTGAPQYDTIDSLSKQGHGSGRTQNAHIPNDSLNLGSRGAFEQPRAGGLCLPVNNLYKKSLLSRVPKDSRGSSKERSESTASKNSKINSAGSSADANFEVSSPMSNCTSPISRFANRFDRSNQANIGNPIIKKSAFGGNI